MNIVIIGTLDTKAEEVNFIRERVFAARHTPIIIDPGSGGSAQITANITREAVAEAGGGVLTDLLATKDKALIQNTMTAGLVNVVTKLFGKGRLDGVIAVGGGQGTGIATAAMRALPVGIPKVMVSTVACGQTTFGPYVGTKDITMIHSVADISGLNGIIRTILAQAAAAVVAMAEVQPEAETNGELIAITQAGVTTPGVMAIKDKLEAKGYEVIAFHCNGIGGQAMEELIADGKIKGVIDYSPHEITDLIYDGLMPAQPGRMTVAGKHGVPVVVAPGCTDVRLHEWRDDFPPELLERVYIRHTPTHTHFRTTYDEMSAVGKYMADALNEAQGPAAVMVPTQGYSMLNREGSVFFDEGANQGFHDALKEHLRPNVRLIPIDAHINDEACADKAVDLLLESLGK